MAARKNGIRKQAKGPPPSDPLAYLAWADAKLGRLIARVGPCGLEVESVTDTFAALARSIVYQQLAGKAAATIHGRLLDLHEGRVLTPAALLALEEAALRGAGVSGSKALALRDLARRSLDGTVPPVEALASMTDDAVVAALTPVRGIGRWSVEMLLMFRLGRLDVLPAADYGVRMGFQLTFGGDALPTEKELLARGERWRPYRSIASWYLWRAVDLAKAKAQPKGRPTGKPK